MNQSTGHLGSLAESRFWCRRSGEGPGCCVPNQLTVAGVWTGLFGARVHAVILSSTFWLSPGPWEQQRNSRLREQAQMKTILTSRIVTSDRERAQPMLAGEGYQLASSCVSSFSPFSCFSGWATGPARTRQILGSPRLCDSHVTCHCSPALPHLISAIKIPFPCLIPASLRLAVTRVPAREGLLNHPFAAHPGWDYVTLQLGLITQTGNCDTLTSSSLLFSPSPPF